MMSPDGNYRSNWDGMYEQIRRFNEYFTMFIVALLINWIPIS